MAISPEIQAQMEQLQRLIQVHIEQRDEHQASQIKALQAELAQEYDERSRLSKDILLLEERLKSYQSAPQVLEEKERLVREREQLDARMAAMEQSNQSLSQQLSALKLDLQREAEQNSRLTLEMVDLKLELEAQRRQQKGLSEPVPLETKLPDLIPEPEVAESEEQKLRRLAYQDATTGQPNAHLGERYLAQQVEQGKSVALVVVDVIRLREWNLVLGRAKTDRVLAALADRLSLASAGDGVLVRGEEDEFWLILPRAKGGPLGKKGALDAAAKVIQKFNELQRSPIEIEDQKVQMWVSCGVACAQDAMELETVLERARLAGAAARKEGRNRLQAFQPEMEKSLRQRHEQMPLLWQAWQRGQFDLRFQPIYDLHNGFLKGVESLLRWEHPVQGILEPGQFLESALESGVLLPVGDWVAQQICALSKEHRQVYWSMNVSALELLQADFVRRFTKSLESARLPKPDFVVLEISEGQLAAENLHIRLAIQELRRWNVGIAIDDFGFQGFSLRQMRNLGAAFLKLGTEITHNLEDVFYRTLVRGAVAAAECLGAKVIAEGVENQGQVDRLRELGCHWGQGHQFCSPLSLTELESRLERRNRG